MGVRARRLATDLTPDLSIVEENDGFSEENEPVETATTPPRTGTY